MALPFLAILQLQRIDAIYPRLVGGWVGFFRDLCHVGGNWWLRQNPLVLGIIPHLGEGDGLGCYLDFPLGYNDFNNLVMQTLWWLHNYCKFSDTIIKKDFPFFFSRFLHIGSQSSKKVLIWPLKNFFGKKLKKVSKNAEFHADFESVEKVLKKCTEKSY